MEKMENDSYNSNYWMAFWLASLAFHIAFTVVNQSINYTSISAVLISLWMLSLNDTVIDKISTQYKQRIQQLLRILFGFAVILNALDFMEII